MLWTQVWPIETADHVLWKVLFVDAILRLKINDRFRNCNLNVKWFKRSKSVYVWFELLLTKCDLRALIEFCVV
jgi:hypothetical protein